MRYVIGLALGLALGIILTFMLWWCYTRYQNYHLPANIITWQSPESNDVCYLAVRHNNVQAMYCYRQVE